MASASRIVFRADASLQIGTGHVMRCLTLADALAARGAQCHFICREHAGNLVDFIRAKGFVVHALPAVATVNAGEGASSPGLVTPGVVAPEPARLPWLGATQAQDAEACASILAALMPEWLIVDHYALDARWELALEPRYRRLMVIDDLADRPHACNLLLDQTFGRDVEDYRPWVPADSQLLCGSQYALLRPEFAELRPYSLQRRVKPRLKQLLITMGGVDKDNATGQVLQALRACPLPADCRIIVVMGATALWLDEVRNQARDMPWPTQVMVGVSGMAQLMADSDLAIGAAGATSWERCCLGLPTIMLVLAENQQNSADGLARVGAAMILERWTQAGDVLPAMLLSLLECSALLEAMSRRAARIVDGNGVSSVIRYLEI